MKRITAAIAGIAFAAFPLLRPWGDKTGSKAEMAAAFADDRWVIAHTCGMIGWITLAAAFAAGSRSRLAAWLLGGGAMVLLPYYGAETFGLHALATTDPSLVVAQESLRNGGIQATMFGCGLLLAAAAGVTVLVTSRRRWTVVLMALGLVTYLPQFFTPAPARIAHGLILGIGCLIWAFQSSMQADPVAATGPAVLDETGR